MAKLLSLSEVLDRLNLSQTQLAKDCGVSSQAICQIVNGSRNPSPALVSKIAKAINASVELDAAGDFRFALKRSRKAGAA